MLRFIAAALLCITLTACDQKQYETETKSRWTTITVETYWLPESQINSVCTALINGAENPKDGGGIGMFNGCARSKPNNKNICEVYAVEPEDFDDKLRLQVFGHEVWHCLGAMHK